MTQPADQPLSERVSALEVGVENTRKDVASLKVTVEDGLDKVQQALLATRTTNWSVVMAGIAVVLALYAAAIRPVESDIARQEIEAKTVAAAVLEQNRLLSKHEVDIARANERIAALRVDMATIVAEGTPVLDRRLSILEYRLGIQQPTKRQ